MNLKAAVAELNCLIGGDAFYKDMPEQHSQDAV